MTTASGYVEIHPGGPGAGAGSDPAAPELPGRGGGGVDLLVDAPRPRVRLPLLGFPGVNAPPSGPDPEQGLICHVMCSCKNVRDIPNDELGPPKRGKTGPNRQNCVDQQLWKIDDASGHTSTIKAEVPYDMSQKPPAPIMSRTQPTRATRRKPAGSKIPDIVLVKDPTKPPTQDNIRKIIELKFPGDRHEDEQIAAYNRIAGRRTGVRVEVWTLERCGCEKEEPVPPPVPVPSSSTDKVAALLLALAILALILDDAVGGEADDLLIPELIKQMLGKLKPAF